jgi:hypothetical protein
MAHRLADYLLLVDALATAGFRLHPIRDYFATRVEPPFVFLRHDVDRRPARAVAMARAEAALNVCATYYFRCDSKMCFPATAIAEIAALDHEIGFHYECLSRCRGDVTAALNLFERELAALRQLARIDTIAPHGAPLSAISNMTLTGEAVDGAAARLEPTRFDLLGDATGIDFTDTLYVTDTGGTFGSPHNLRDRSPGPMLDAPIHPRRLADHVLKRGARSIVLSCHPERWPSRWSELFEAAGRDAAINLVKRLIRRRRRESD